MALDAVIIADGGVESFSGTNPLKLHIEGRVADVQTVVNFVENGGRLSHPIVGDGQMSWASAPKLNGIYLISYLTRHGLDVAGIDSFTTSREQLHRLLQERPLAIVISTTFITSKQALTRMVAQIREMSSEVKIIIGGPFVYASFLIHQRSQEPGYVPEEAGADFLFLEEDELPVADLFIVDSQGEDILCRALKQIKENGKIGVLPSWSNMR